MLPVRPSVSISTIEERKAGMEIKATTERTKRAVLATLVLALAVGVWLLHSGGDEKAAPAAAQPKPVQWEAPLVVVVPEGANQIREDLFEVQRLDIRKRAIVKAPNLVKVTLPLTIDEGATFEAPALETCQHLSLASGAVMRAPRLTSVDEPMLVAKTAVLDAPSLIGARVHLDPLRVVPWKAR